MHPMVMETIEQAIEPFSILGASNWIVYPIFFVLVGIFEGETSVPFFFGIYASAAVWAAAIYGTLFSANIIFLATQSGVDWDTKWASI